MRIQPPDNLVNHYATKSLRDSSQHTAAGTQAIVNELGEEFASIIDRSFEQYEADSTQKIHAAKQAIKDGTLESAEAIESAVDNLLAFGV